MHHAVLYGREFAFGERSGVFSGRSIYRKARALATISLRALTRFLVSPLNPRRALNLPRFSSPMKITRVIFIAVPFVREPLSDRRSVTLSSHARIAFIVAFTYQKPRKHSTKYHPKEVYEDEYSEVRC